MLPVPPKRDAPVTRSPVGPGASRARWGASRLRAASWSPYAVGVGIGLLSWFAFATAGDGLGITTAFEHTGALMQRSEQNANPYFAGHAPQIDWEWMLVVGVFLGSFLSSKLSDDRRHPMVPTMWRNRFGGSVALRFGLAFVGGMVMMLGARLARGCTSGHGITGTLQLAVSSWLFIVLAFAVGCATAVTLYGRPRRTGGE
jgi:uncharacterized protein